MAANATEVLAGGSVLAAALGFLIHAGQMTGASVGDDRGYGLKASFRSAEGISVGADVRLAGVRIGAVTGLELNPETFRADAMLSVREDIAIPDDSTAVISSEGLLGGSFMEIVPGGSIENLGPGDEIVHTQGAVSLIGLLAKFAAGGDSEE